MTATIQRRYTLEEYLKMEYRAKRRHYYYRGIVKPMGYTSDNHGLIVANLIGELHSRMKETLFRVYPSDRMLFVPGCQLNYYPDVMVIEGKPKFHEHSAKMKATLNPCAIIEVASDSTEDYDRTEKWYCYRQIPSLRQYLIISQKQCYIDVYNRIDQSDKWENTYLAKAEESVNIAGFEIKLSDIYHLVEFPADVKQKEGGSRET